ncbi:MAG TPA: hypothetical protein VJG32_16340 [Anaerolineae bacterium]|nr:hypothetical protein [Anaerolineae bacterium]
MELIAGVAAIGAVVAGFAALVFFWQTQEAQRASRRALFDTERQVHLDRMRRARMTGLGLIALAAILFVLNVGGSAIANPPPTATPTLTPSPTSPPPTIGPSPTPTLPATATPTLSPATATPALQTGTVTNTGTIGLRLRDAPNGNLIDYLPDGTVVTLLPDAPVTTEDGIEWRHVTDPQGREGWVAVQYLTINP